MADSEIGCWREFAPKLCRTKTNILVLKSVAHSLFFLHHIVANIFGVKLLIVARNSNIDKVKELAEYPYGFGTNWNFVSIDFY